jgi:hypothetical protein
MGKVLLMLAALAPSLWMLWQAGGIPHLGYFHDDGIYAGTAAAIADGRGLRVESLPGEPWQVKYPPLFPLYLAIGVHWEPVLTFLVWVVLPVLLWQIWRWRNDGWIVLVVGWNLYSVVFASTALSEVFSTIWVVLAVRLLEKDRVRLSALSAAMAYLSRTALIAMPAAAVLWLFWRRRWRDGFVYGAIFAPFFLGWSWFTATHMKKDLSGGWVYYISYPQVFRESMSWELLPTVLQTNIQAMVGSLGGVLFFNAGDSFWEVNFARLILFAAIAGIIRRARSEGAGPYEWMAIPYILLLVVWNFVPNERFVYPLLPLLAAGLVGEMRHFREMLRVTWVKQRAATVVIGGLVAAGVLWMAERNVMASIRNAPSLPNSYREMAPDREQAYAWIRANTPPDANFLAYEDPALRRHTGRHGMGIHCPSRHFYRNDIQAIYSYHDELITSMRKERLDYILIGPNDLAQDILPKDREKILTDWKTRADLETVYENPRYIIRKLRPLQSEM